MKNIAVSKLRRYYIMVSLLNTVKGFFMLSIVQTGKKSWDVYLKKEKKGSISAYKKRGYGIMYRAVCFLPPGIKHGDFSDLDTASEFIKWVFG